MFARLRGHLHRADVVFGQLECPLSARGAPMPHVRLAMRSDPAVAPSMRRAGFDVVSVAGNHCMDWGTDALSDTLRCVSEAGILTCGAGATIEQARQPATISVNGLLMGFLAYSSILPQGYWAEAHNPGCAPMRAHTLYEQIETDQPGTPARVHTYAHREDLEALCRDVRDAKRRHRVVIVSMHWGIHFVPATIADYQKQVAYAAIDAGADAVLGHHPHILKGIEIYHGRPIFYSLGNFAIEQPSAFMENLTRSSGFREIAALNSDFDTRRAYMPPKDTQRSVIAKLIFNDGEIAQTRFMPVIVNDRSEPAVLTRTDVDFERIVNYVAEISASQSLNTCLTAEGDEVIVQPQPDTLSPA
jgi:poly-gamma-glutamate capsule biosynthesis protein CapA/YwtB (metallophosphatase superfamily)